MLFDRHITRRFVALLGVIVALNVLVCPTVRVAAVGFTRTPLTRIGVERNVVLVAIAWSPIIVNEVIVVVPSDLAVATPLLFTVATSGLLLDHTTLFTLRLIKGILPIMVLLNCSL